MLEEADKPFWKLFCIHCQRLSSQTGDLASIYCTYYPKLSSRYRSENAVCYLSKITVTISKFVSMFLLFPMIKTPGHSECPRQNILLLDLWKTSPSYFEIITNRCFPLSTRTIFKLHFTHFQISLKNQHSYSCL